jgi:hypothetical protein
MTVEHTRLNIIRAESVRIRHVVARTKQIVVAAKELLSMPAPDTFVGRKTHEPFPKEMTSTSPQPQAEAAFDQAGRPLLRYHLR